MKGNDYRDFTVILVVRWRLLDFRNSKTRLRDQHSVDTVILDIDIGDFHVPLFVTADFFWELSDEFFMLICLSKLIQLDEFLQFIKLIN